MYYFIFNCLPLNLVSTAPVVDPYPAGPFMLEIQDEIKKHQVKCIEHLNRLKEVLGVEFQYAVDFRDLHQRLPRSVFKKNMGELVLDHYLGALVNHLVDFINKYPSTRQSFLIKVGKKRIQFEPFLRETKNTIDVVIQNGVLCIQLRPEQFGFLPEKTGEKISELFT